MLVLTWLLRFWLIFFEFYYFLLAFINLQLKLKQSLPFDEFLIEV